MAAFKLATLDGKHAVLVKHDGHTYIWRYCYDTMEEAVRAMTGLYDSWGQPSGIEQDLASNYLPYVRQPDRYSMAKRTTGKSYYIWPELQPADKAHLP